MTLAIHTARIGVRDRDALDITRKSGTGDGLAFAPSWAILTPALEARERAEALARDGLLDGEVDRLVEAGKIDSAAWEAYVPAYLAEMRASYRARRRAWDDLLARKRVVLVCYCAHFERCHRTLLGRDILPRLGATYIGEVAPQHEQRGLFG